MAWASGNEIRLGYCTWYHAAGELRRCVVAQSWLTYGDGTASVSRPSTSREVWIWSEEQGDAEPLTHGRMYERSLLHDMGIKHRDVDTGLIAFSGKIRRAITPELAVLAAHGAIELAKERVRGDTLFAALAGIELEQWLTDDERESILKGRRVQ